MFSQHVVDRILAVFCVRRQRDNRLGATVTMATLVIHHAAPQCQVGGFLILGAQGGDDVKTAGIDLVLVLLVQDLAHHFGGVLGVDCIGFSGRADLDVFIHRLLILLCGDEIKLTHALQDVLLADVRPLGIDHRVIRRGGFRQPGQHGELGDAQLCQRLAEVGLRSTAETVGALPEVNLVQVQLEDLVFRQRALDLVGQHDFIDLAGYRLVTGQEKIAGNLHRDGRCSLRRTGAKIVHDGTHQANKIDAAMLVETTVLDRQHRIFHLGRDLLDRQEITMLFPELADQHVVSRKYAQRNLGLVIDQRIERRHVRPDDQERIAKQQRHAGSPHATQAKEGNQEAAFQGAGRRSGQGEGRGGDAGQVMRQLVGCAGTAAHFWNGESIDQFFLPTSGDALRLHFERLPAG
ncbi:hypothetical protein IMCC9480_3530 [Oxalobacteraceae bacterium IMCC9480]|nr:hypothetical protein IMCC9480_3530 [Oxalobacteraceae bacterium IMCC9480]